VTTWGGKNDETFQFKPKQRGPTHGELEVGGLGEMVRSLPPPRGSHPRPRWQSQHQWGVRRQQKGAPEGKGLSEYFARTTQTQETGCVLGVMNGGCTNSEGRRLVRMEGSMKATPSRKDRSLEVRLLVNQRPTKILC